MLGEAVEAEAEVMFTEGGLEGLGFAQAVEDVLAGGLQPEMGAGRSTGEVCLTG